MKLTSFLDQRRSHLAEQVRTLRLRNRLSQAELANLLNCSRARIARIERGDAGYGLEELELLAIYLGREPGELLELAGAERGRLDVLLTEGVYTNVVEEKGVKCQMPPDGAFVARVRADFPIPDTLFTDILFSPDNCFLAGKVAKGPTADSAFFCVWDRKDGALIHSDEVGFYGPTGRAFSPDAHFVAYIKERHIVIYNLLDQQVSVILDPFAGKTYQKACSEISTPKFDENILLQFSLDGKWLFSYCDEHGSLRAWDTQDWSVQRTYILSAMIKDLDTIATSDDFDGSVLVNAVDDSGMEELMASFIIPVPGTSFLLMAEVDHQQVYLLDPSKSASCFGYFGWQERSIDKAAVHQVFSENHTPQWILAFWRDDGVLALEIRNNLHYPGNRVERYAEPCLVSQLVMPAQDRLYAIKAWEGSEEHPRNQPFPSPYTVSLCNLINNQAVALLKNHKVEYRDELEPDDRVFVSADVQNVACIENENLVIHKLNISPLEERTDTGSAFETQYRLLLNRIDTEERTTHLARGEQKKSKKGKSNVP
jgi:DNA-binding XRE family transcriptional regulator